MSPGAETAGAEAGLRAGPAFVLFNGLTISGFALGGLIAPEAFWGWFGVPLDPPMARVMAWYLLVFGLGGLAVWRDPGRHPWVVVSLGLEKLGPALLFPWITLSRGLRWPLLGIGVADALLAAALLTYGARLLSDARR